MEEEDMGVGGEVSSEKWFLSYCTVPESPGPYWFIHDSNPTLLLELEAK